ncbi:MAG TPA: CoA ester lyase [Geobacterales bacterium]|nr:CoA ester lyase [Geobacterales bacterium]
MRAHRCILFTPANDERKIKKLDAIAVEAVVLDLEDSVPTEEKAKARQQIKEAIPRLKEKKEIGVRINSLDTKFWLHDILETYQSSPAFYVIPKVRSEQQVVTVSEVLKALNFDVPLIIAIEDAEGLSRVFEIANSCDQLAAIMFGKIDFNASVGGEEGNYAEMLARAMISLAASTRGLQAIDAPCVELNDLKKVEDEAKLAKSMGYTAKMAIHPAQIDVINRIFMPSNEEINLAKKIFEIYETAKKKGVGAIRLENKMIDEAVFKQAVRILQRAGII